MTILPSKLSWKRSKGFHLGVRVLHGEEDIPGGEDRSLGHGLDAEGEAPAMLLQYVLPTYTIG